MGGFGSNRKVIFTLGVILFLSFVLADCGKKNKGTPKKENAKTSYSPKKSDLDLEPELKERKFFQEDAFGQPKKYSEEDGSNNGTYRSPKKKPNRFHLISDPLPVVRTGIVKTVRVFTYTIPEKYTPEVLKMINDMDTETYSIGTETDIRDTFKTIKKWERERIDSRTVPYSAEDFTTMGKARKVT